MIATNGRYKYTRCRTSMLYLTVMWAVILVMMCSIAHCQTPVAAGSNIPVIINIYNNVGTGPGGTITPADEAKAKEAVEEASKILNKAGYKLTVVKVNKYPFKDSAGNPTSLGDADNNGDITDDSSPTATDGEWRGQLAAGEKEVAGLGPKANGAGVKINFTRSPESGKTTLGWAVHDHPVVTVKHDATKEKTGNTIAHEICHVLTLSKGHKIDDSTNADAGGHTPDTPGASGKDNLLNGTGSGDKLTPAQIAEMWKNRWKRGLCTSQWEKAFPAIKVQAQQALVVDNLDDHVSGAAHNDLSSIRLSSINGEPNVAGVIALADLFGDPVNSQYAVVFNSDANPTTGFAYGPFTGMEFAVEISVERVGGMLMVNGTVRSLAPGAPSNPLPLQPTLVDEARLVDPAVGPARDVFSHIHFTVPKPMIGMPISYNPAVPLIPVGVTAKETVDVVDSASGIMYTDGWLRTPTLQTFGNGVPVPGAPYQIEVHGLQPNEPFNLYVNERLVFSDLLDPTGSFVGEFIFPADLSDKYWYFLTAQDSTGMIASTNTCPNSVPTISAAKALADGGYVELAAGSKPGVPVSRAFNGFFYVQSDDRSSGIRVDSTFVMPPEVDMDDKTVRVSVFGTVNTNSNGERYIQAQTVTLVSIEDEALKPVYMINRSVGGDEAGFNPATGAGQMGVTGGNDLNNMGLLISTWGEVLEVESVTPPALPTWMKIDDGSVTPVKCSFPVGSGLTPHGVGSHVMVTGVSSCEYAANDDIVCQIRMKKHGDDRLAP